MTVLRAETAINVTGGLAELASVMASAASAFTMLHEGRVAVVVAPFVARRLAAEGRSKDDVRRWLHAEARVPAAAWQSVVAARDGAPVAGVGRPRPPGPLPVVKEPGDITVVVAGADLAIPQLAYFPSWGFPPCRVTREIAGADRGPCTVASRLQVVAPRLVECGPVISLPSANRCGRRNVLMGTLSACPSVICGQVGADGRRDFSPAAGHRANRALAGSKRSLTVG